MFVLKFINFNYIKSYIYGDKDFNLEKVMIFLFIIVYKFFKLFDF